MTSWLQWWRNAFFRIFEIEYLRNWKRHRYNSFTVAIYSTKAIISRLISITSKKKIIVEDIAKSRAALEVTGWAEFRWLFRMKISLLFSEISLKICEPKVKFNKPSRPQLWRHDCNYDVMHFFESLTSKISGTERDTDIILSLLQSTRQGLSSGVLFQ